jgi:hypothetical protein
MAGSSIRAGGGLFSGTGELLGQLTAVDADGRGKLFQRQDLQNPQLCQKGKVGRLSRAERIHELKDRTSS